MITVHKLMGGIGTVGYTIVIDDHRSFENFKELVQRGSNLWPDATPEMKEFADKITNNGVVLQDYKSQDTSKKQCEHLNTRAIEPKMNNGHHLYCLVCKTTFNHPITEKESNVHQTPQL